MDLQSPVTGAVLAASSNAAGRLKAQSARRVDVFLHLLLAHALQQPIQRGDAASEVWPLVEHHDLGAAAIAASVL